MFASSSSPTRRIAPTHKEWIPHNYQERAVDFLIDRQSAALFLDPGLGKTSITLAAFDQLRSEGIAKKMLVIAPLRVCQLVWEQEGQEWTQFRHLKFSLLHGPKKKAALDKEADIYLINPEGISWLNTQYFEEKKKGQPWKQKEKWPFDTVTIDELTRFKNAQSVRHGALMPIMPKVQRRWGLTGTPIPNGYLDLFGQMKILDGGLSLGTYYTRFRDKYFEADFTGFKYLLRRGASKAIEKAIKPYVLRMAAEDYLELPPRIDDIRSVVMPKKARAIYEEMKKEMVAELADTVVEAGNAAAVYSKLKQMANGAVYAGDGVFEPKKVIHIHDAKIEALEELVEELAGTPLLVGYEFRHDLARLQKLFPGVPYIGSGVSGAQVKQIEKDWNAGKLPMLFAHPASAGHGLNFQKGNAFHIAWFSATWDYELYDQFIKRILRQGNEATVVFNHIFIVEDTIDNKTRDAILQKGFTQDAFCAALNAEIYHTGKTATPPHGETKDDIMVKKLSRRNKAEVEEEDEEEEDEAPRTTRRTSKRGSKSKQRDADEEEEGEDEDEAPRKTKRVSKRGTKTKLRGRASDDDEDPEEEEEDEAEDDRPTRKSARKKFSKVVREELDEEEEGEEDEEEEDRPKKRRGTRKKAEVDDEEEDPPKKRRSTRKAGKASDDDESKSSSLGDDDDRFDVLKSALVERAIIMADEHDTSASDLATLTAVLRELKLGVG